MSIRSNDERRKKYSCTIHENFFMQVRAKYGALFFDRFADTGDRLIDLFKKHGRLVEPGSKEKNINFINQRKIYDRINSNGCRD